MRKIPFWGKIALISITILAVMPLFISFAFSLLNEQLHLSWSTKVLDSIECKKLSPDISCKSGLEILKASFDPKGYSVFGIANTTPLVTCTHNRQTEIIKPNFLVSNVGIYSNSDLQCNGQLVAFLLEKTKSPANAWILPVLISGDEASLTRLITATLFYHLDIRVLFAITALFQIGLTLLISSTIGGAYSRPKYLFSFITVAMMSIVNGGLLEKASGYDLWSAVPFLKSILGFLWVATFAYETTWDNLNKKRFSGIVLLATSVAILCGLLAIPSKIIWSAIFIGWFLIALYSRFKFLPVVLLVLNVFYLQPVYTSFLTIPQFAGSLFLLIYILGYQIEFVRMMLINWRLAQFSNTICTVKGQRAFVKLLSKVLKIKRVSFAVANNDSFEYWIYSEERQRPQRKLPEGQSSVISKVYATGEALLDLDINSLLGLKLANNSTEYKSNRFTAVPVSVNGELEGVLCFTDYQQNIRHPDLRMYLIKTFEEVGVNLAKGISNSNNTLVAEIEKEMAESFRHENSFTVEQIATNFLSLLSEKFNISGYLAKIKNSDNSIEILTGSENFLSIKEQLNKLNFTVNSKNEFGPISLAFNKEGPIVLQNWRPLSDKLSHAAKEMYAKMETNSIMTIPIIRKFGSSDVKYLLWLQTNRELTFSQQFQSLGLMLQTKMEQVVDTRVSNLIGDTVFSLADSDTIQNVVYGQDTIVRQTGELIMLDLGKSTVLSGSLGKEEYKRLTDYFLKISVYEMQIVGFQLQMVIGDALLFTKPNIDVQVNRKELLNRIIKCDTLLKVYAAEVAPSIYNQTEPALRACSVVGDISRDIVKGSGGGWAIVGATISEVHKIESAAKRYRSGIYFELDNRLHSEAFLFTNTNISPWSGSASMRYFDFLQITSIKAA